MSDQHASRSYRSKAPKGTRHTGCRLGKIVDKSDPRVFAVNVAEGKGGKQSKMLKLMKTRKKKKDEAGTEGRNP